MTTSSQTPLPLDRNGLLPESRFPPHLDAPSYLVFAQQRDARIDLAAWQASARRFFGTELAVTVPKLYGPVAPARDGAHLVLLRGDRPGAARSVLLSPRSDAELAAADRADGGAGLALLAKRCPTVIRVSVDVAPAASDEPDADDVALLLAAIVASCALGPILSPDRRRILGVKTARLELERMSAARG
jgi:hypothetical protein